MLEPRPELYVSATTGVVVRTVLAEFGPACAVSARGMCHRSGDVPPVDLTFACAQFLYLSCSQTRVTGLACSSTRTRAPTAVAHGSPHGAGAHSVDHTIHMQFISNDEIHPSKGYEDNEKDCQPACQSPIVQIDCVY